MSNIEQGMSNDEGLSNGAGKAVGRWKFRVGYWVFEAPRECATHLPGVEGDKPTEYPISNKDCPMMKERRLDIRNSVLVIGCSQLIEKDGLNIEYRTRNVQ